MKSKKVILSVISGIILCTALVLFSSCNNGVATNQPTNDNHIHDYKKQVVAPTCTENGYTTYICKNCGDTYVSDYIVALGHNYENGVCIRCGEKADKDATSDEYFTFTLLENGTYEIRAKDKNNLPAEVVLPSTHEGKPVTYIGIRAFWDCSSLTSIEIPSRVTSIGYEAFFYCRRLTSITIDENNQNYKSIDGNLYSKDGKTLIQYAIGKTATSFAIPDGVTSIGSSAFSSCSSLTSIEISSSVNSIGEGAFSSCSSLTSIEIPSSVTSIGYLAFSGCKNLTSVTFIENSRLTSIGEMAFSSCSSLTSIEIPSSVTSIGNYAFYDCRSLTSINVDVNNKIYKSIDGNLYSKDGKTLIQYAIGKTATSFSIPDGVTSIGDYAFYGCSSLTSIEIPSSVTSIGFRAFRNCSSLKSVTFKNTSDWWYSSSSNATSGTAISSAALSDKTTAATYLTSTYPDYYWKRT